MIVNFHDGFLRFLNKFSCVSIRRILTFTYLVLFFHKIWQTFCCCLNQAHASERMLLSVANVKKFGWNTTNILQFQFSMAKKDTQLPRPNKQKRNGLRNSRNTHEFVNTNLICETPGIAVNWSSLAQITKLSEKT